MVKHILFCECFEFIGERVGKRREGKGAQKKERRQFIIKH